MSGRVGSITTDIVSDGLVFNMDAANRASHDGNEMKWYNTISLSQSGSLENISTSDFIQNSGSVNVPFINMDGTDDYADISDTSNSSYDHITAAIWVSKKGTVGNFDYYAAAPIDSTAGTWWFRASNPTFGIRTSGPTYTNSSATTLAEGEFAYLVGTYDKQNLKFYKNGTLVSSTSLTTSLTWGSSYNWRLGNYGGPFGAGLNARCAISCFHFYNRALSATEVLHNYNALKGRFGL